jgi:hypothetical protein
MNIGTASLPMLNLQYAQAISLGQAQRAAQIKAQADAIIAANQPAQVNLNSGTFQAEPGFFSTDTGTLPNETGRF